MKYLITAAILASVFFTSCNTSSTDPKGPSKLRMVIPEDPATLDPRKGGDALSSHIHFMLFEGLVKLHEDGSISPAQCYHYDLSSDKKTYTFHLGKTLWSDGKKVTSYDFAQAWKSMLSPSFPSPNAHLLYPIAYAEDAKKGLVSLEDVGIHTPDANTLVIKLLYPTPYFLSLISFCVFSPIPTHIENQNPNWAFQKGKQFVSNGPFILKDWKHNNKLLLAKNPKYHEKQQVKLDSIDLSVIASEITAFQLYQKGEIDLIGQPFSSIPVDAQKYLLPNAEIVISPSAATTFITFNTLEFPFSNSNIRKAFALGINRKDIADNVTQMGEQAAFCAVPPSLKNEKFSHLYDDNQVKEAQEALRAGMEELGVDLKTLETHLEYLYSNTDVSHKVAQVLQQQWLKNLGVKVKLGTTDRKTLMENISKKRHIFAQALYRAQFADPVNILDRFKNKENIKNYSSWENKNFQKLLERSYLESGKQRIETLKRAEEILVENSVVAPLYHLNLCYLAKPYLDNIEFSPVGGMFLERLSIKKNLLEQTSNQ